jgi:hypothetical protein
MLYSIATRFSAWLALPLKWALAQTIIWLKPMKGDRILFWAKALAFSTAYHALKGVAIE